MKIAPGLLVASVMFAAVMASTASATQYNFSGDACVPQSSSDAVNLLSDGAGVTNSINQSTPGYWPVVKVTCPVTGMESTTQTQTELKVRYRSWTGFTSFWQVNNMNLGTTWWSIVKHPCPSNPSSGCTSASSYTGQSLTVTWTGTELYGASFTAFSSYTLRSEIPPKCSPTTCTGSVLQYIQAYWVTHLQS